jgi:hypothetical protein
VAKGAKVDIPDSARKVKDWFRERPGEGIRIEIRSYIRDGGMPHLWRGHTHTKPPAGSKPDYLDEVHLPSADRAGGTLAPCPCCWPEHEKYGKGRVAWFPAEGVIRLIGPQCFARLDPEAHRTAETELRRDLKRRRNASFLLGNIESVEAAIRAADDMLPLAKAVDQIRKNTLAILASQRLPLFAQTRGGSLLVLEQTNEISRNAQGAHISRSAHLEKAYAPLLGRRFIDPAGELLADLVDRGRRELVEARALADQASRDNEGGDATRDRAVRKINTGFRNLQSVWERVEEARAFFSEQNIRTLHAWGRQPNAAFRLHIRRVADALELGGTADSAQIVALAPKALDHRIPSLPAIRTNLDE